jgi:hypothetical protein
LKEKIKAVAATGNLSTGFREETLISAVEGADFLGCDAGSTDTGPYYLGSGNARGPREGTKRNLRLMLREALRVGIPMIIGTAGHAGGRPHLAWTLEIVRELARENGWHFKLASIDSEVEGKALLEAFRRGEIRPLCPAPELNEQTIESADRFVAMMGIEPIQAALMSGAQVIIAGRCSDVAIYAALPVLEGVPRWVAYHAGKIFGMRGRQRGTKVVSRLHGGRVGAGCFHVGTAESYVSVHSAERSGTCVVRDSGSVSLG